MKFAQGYDPAKMARVTAASGFFAALDQSGGSTPKALLSYGYTPADWRSDDDMMALMHAMRVRILTSRSFDGRCVLATILFERTMEATIDGLPIPEYLWRMRGVVPFLKVDQGLEPQDFGVQLMRPMPRLDDLLAHARRLGVFGTKMRSVILAPNPKGVAMAIDQQFEVAHQILSHGLLPILETEVLLESADRAETESIVRERLLSRLGLLSGDQRVLLKLSLPEIDDAYVKLVAHPRVARMLALSGGLARLDACRRLERNQGVIASFSRALTEGLRFDSSLAVFATTIEQSIHQIFGSSVRKTLMTAL